MRRLISVVLLAAAIGVSSQTALAGEIEIPGVNSQPPTPASPTCPSGTQATGDIEMPGIIGIITTIANTIPL
ncbi:MAG TPA: hypothetical protein VK619_01195 [Pyrinomonadaceae bacterium]|nr:hypothetical protein [Pyrinomonadaceae bacterium]